jgi:hypothetical protein
MLQISGENRVLLYRSLTATPFIFIWLKSLIMKSISALIFSIMYSFDLDLAHMFELIHRNDLLPAYFRIFLHKFTFC